MLYLISEFFFFFGSLKEIRLYPNKLLIAKQKISRIILSYFLHATDANCWQRGYSEAATLYTASSNTWYPGTRDEGEGWAKKEKGTSNASIPVYQAPHIPTLTIIVVHLPPTQQHRVIPVLFPVYPGASRCPRTDDRTKGHHHTDPGSPCPLPGLSIPPAELVSKHVTAHSK